ncbi:spore coat protein [Clostridium sp. C2-6-12]|uniref:spore coat protein n=1 Tax=Clostridium sp. C2-6-12 TaxID=2698832 RepID=UPI00137158C6|nr:spore coat protein [Clostridium sp. C2-6-12]
MNIQEITVNENNQIHELLNFKNICLTKSITMSPLVSDEELKAILNEDIVTTKQHIDDLRSLMEKSNSERN